MMKALIIEDETAAARNLAAILRQTAPDVEIVATLESVEESVEWLRSNPHPDLLFMDIHLADGDSFRIFDAVEVTAPVVFTTAYAQYAVDGFDLDAVDFLHKPFSYPRFCRAVEKAQQLRTLRELTRQPVSEEEAITVKVEYKNVKIPLREIVYIEAMDNYVRIHLCGARPALSQMSLKSLAELLPATFVRIHKSFIVPLHRIAAYTRTSLTLCGSDTTLPIGRAFYPDFIEKMNRKND